MEEILTSITEIFILVLNIIQTWLWILLPFLLWPIFKNALLWWRRELWEKRQKYLLLELAFPTEIKKPFSSMEHIFSNLWPIYSNTVGIKNFRKRWIEGKKLQYLSIEIVSIGPYPRFFIRVNRDHRDTVKAALYAQYPDMEITEVKEDYIQGIHWNVPNKNWDLYGFDEEVEKNDLYPIKTYTQFFETKPENIKDEKRLDPMNTLLENLNDLKEDEQMWIQIRLAPVSGKDNDYKERGRKLVDKLIHRKAKTKDSFLWKALTFFLPKAEQREEKELIPPEMKLTPREREIVQAVENKMGKNVFQTNIRCIYFGHERIFKAGRKSLAENYFSSFSLPDMNIMKKNADTKTKILHVLRKRRLFSRKRRMFRRYIMRETPFYPKKGGTYVLSIEELATIFHPPIEVGKVGSLIQQVHAKKGEAPMDLPV